MLVQRILDYRAAKVAVRLFNGSAEERKRLGEDPGLMNILLEMQRAQGSGLTMDDVVRDIQRKGITIDADDEDTFG